MADAYGLVGRGEWVVVQWSAPAAAVAFREELLYRGVIQRVSEERLGTWLALRSPPCGSAGSTRTIRAPSLFDGVMIALFGGVLLGACFVATRRLWLAVGVHAAWNFVEGGVFGTPVSGYAIPGVLRSSLERSGVADGRDLRPGELAGDAGGDVRGQRGAAGGGAAARQPAAAAPQIQLRRRNRTA